MMPSGFTGHEQAIEHFCQSRGIKRLAVFGSALRRTMRPDSDLDLLVEFIPGRPVGYLDLAEMEIELSDMFCRKVDLRTPAELSGYFRRDVQLKAEPIYVRR